MFGFGMSKDSAQVPVNYSDEDELEQGFDLHSNNLFGASDVNWVVGDNKQQGRLTESEPSFLKFYPPKSPGHTTEEKKEDEEEVKEDLSESSFEDLEFEKQEFQELSVSRIRNFTNQDYTLTILNDNFRKGNMF